jgi:hypothetical protein
MCGLDSADSGHDVTTDFCEHDNETSGSKHGAEFLHQLNDGLSVRDLSFSQHWRSKSKFSGLWRLPQHYTGSQPRRNRLGLCFSRSPLPHEISYGNKSRSFWVVTPWSVVVGYQRFGGPSCFQLHSEDRDLKYHQNLHSYGKSISACK